MGEILFSQDRIGVNETQKLSTLTVKARPPFTPSGTVAKSTASSTVTGSGTAFLTEIGIGDRITIPGGAATETRGVVAISSDTSLTVDAEFTTTASAQSATCLPSIARFASDDGVTQITVSDQGHVRIGPVEKRPTGAIGFDTICQVHADTDVPFLLTLTNTNQAQGVALWVDGSALSASAIDNNDGEEIFLAGKNSFQFLTGLRFSGDPIDANHTPTGAQCALYVDAGSGGVTITLPSVVGNANRVYYIYKVAGAGSVTVDPDGSETINGANAAKSITTQWSGLRLTAWVDTPGFYPDGVGWIATLLTGA